MPDLPSGWEERTSTVESRGTPYYVNQFTKEKQWDKPTKPAIDPSLVGNTFPSMQTIIFFEEACLFILKMKNCIKFHHI